MDDNKIIKLRNILLDWFGNYNADELDGLVYEIVELVEED